MSKDSLDKLISRRDFFKIGGGGIAVGTAAIVKPTCLFPGNAIKEIYTTKDGEETNEFNPEDEMGIHAVINRRILPISFANGSVYYPASKEELELQGKVLSPGTNEFTWYSTVPYITDITEQARIRVSATSGFTYETADKTIEIIDESKLHTVSGTLKDLLYDKHIENAEIRIIKGIYEDYNAYTDESGKFEFPDKMPSGEYRIKILHDDHYERETNMTVNGTYLNLDIIPLSFNMEFFNEVCRGRGATERWMKQPKFYIVDGPVEGYDNFHTPTEKKVEIVEDIINNGLPLFTNSFIQTPTYIERGTNPPIEPVGDKWIEKDGWIVITWGNTGPVNGWHGEQVENNVIYSAAVGIGSFLDEDIKQVPLQEISQTMGARSDSNLEDSVFNPGTRFDNYTQIDLHSGKIIYNRPPGNRHPDKDPE